MILGVDPGFSGALCLWTNTGEANILDMPLGDREMLTARDKFRAIDPQAITDWLRPHAPDVELAVIERVGAAPGQGVSSTFRFGEGYGMIQGIMAALSIKRIIKPPPAVWKSSMALTSDKKKSLELAANIAPRYAHLFAKRKNDGRAEALLLAVFGAKSLGWPCKYSLGEIKSANNIW